MRTYRKAVVLAIVSLGMSFSPVPASARSLPANLLPVPLTQSDTQPQRFSTYWGIIRTGEIDASFNCDGTFGCNMSYWSDSLRPTFSFAAPAGSQVDYLFGGAFWIGGIVGDDTLVTTAFDGWQNVSETEPTATKPGTLTRIWSSTGIASRAEFADTFAGGWDHPHFPLGIKGILRAYWWDTVPNWSKTIVFDLILSNIGGKNIQKGYLGLFFDPDIYLRGDQLDMSDLSDDLCGSFRSHGMAYAIDAGKRTIDGQFVDSLSPIGAFGLKLLAAWPLVTDTNFNWWFGSASSACNFGPRQRGTLDQPYRDFQTGGTGEPKGDKNKYYVMSHREWDYDTYLIGTIGDSNAVWMDPLQGPTLCDDVTDIRCLLSAGSFDLPPDSSVRFVFALLAGDSVHTDPQNYRDNMLTAHHPDSFYAKLDFSDLIQSGTIADALAPMLLDPLQPVTGLHEEPKNGDSVTIAWDPWVFQDVTGYDVYLSPVSPDSLPYPGLAPPWLRPSVLNQVATVEKVHKYVLDTLSPHTIYMVSVANRLSNTVGPACDPIFVQRGSRLPAPKPDRPFLFAREGDSVTISWQSPVGVNVDHYCVYKFTSEFQATSPYHPFYDSGRAGADLTPVDSFDLGHNRYFYYAMNPAYTIDSSTTLVIEPHCDDSAAYLITAVDRYGFETEFSRPVVTYATESPNRDIIVLTRATGNNAGDGLTQGDSIIAFYDSLLKGYDYKIYNLANSDSANGGGRTDIHTYGPFRLLILDANLNDHYISNPVYDSTPRLITQYLATGGRVAYFGQFNETVTGYTFKTYPVLSDFMTETFSLDSIAGSQLLVYVINGINGLDTLTGFTIAESVDASYPSIEYDTSRYVLKPSISSVWPDFLGPQTASFVPNRHGQVTHLFRSHYPASSLQEGRPVGVRTQLPDTETWAFGFHLWYMRYDQARRLIDAIMVRIPTGIEENRTGRIPRDISLSQNYPNPFNPSTTIEYAVPTRSNVQLDLFNILGQNVRTLVAEPKLAGEYKAIWDGRDNHGRSVSTGIYLYRLRVGEAVMTKKMLLLK